MNSSLESASKNFLKFSILFFEKKYSNEELKTFFNERWTNIKNLQETNLKFDLIYASHSLEHVHNINSTLKIFNDISNNDTIFFFEVPNCFSKQQIKIQPPHTYYFKRDFFLNNFIFLVISKSVTRFFNPSS